MAERSHKWNEKDRTSAGITKSKVFRSTDDPNDVLLLQDVADVSKARTWYGSSEMKVGDGKERRSRLAQHPRRSLTSALNGSETGWRVA